MEDQSPQLINHSLNTVLGSNEFSRAPRLRRLLQYLVHKSIESGSKSLKGYTIAVDVLGRKSDFDPNTASIVRVVVRRLRSKLEKYYASEGKGDLVRFYLPKGEYALHYELIEPQRQSTFSHEGTVSLDAFDSLMHGLGQYWKYTPDSVTLAINHFTQALDFDPGYAAAHAWLSRAMVFEWIMCWSDGDNILDTACQHARTAVEINKYLPYAHSALGWAELWRKNGLAAVAACRKAVALDSNSADGLMFLSMSLSASGQGKEALQYIQMGMRLAPHPGPFHLLALGQALFVSGQHQASAAALERACELSPTFMPGQYNLCWLYKLLGHDDKSRAILEDIHDGNGGRCAQVRPPWIDATLAANHVKLVRNAGLDH